MSAARVDPTTGCARRGCLRPCDGWIGFDAAPPCSLLNDCHPRPVNAYARPTPGSGPKVAGISAAVRVACRPSRAIASRPRQHLVQHPLQTIEEVGPLGVLDLDEPAVRRSRCRPNLYRDDDPLATQWVAGQGQL